MARRLLAQTITPRDLTSWAHQFVTWDGTPLADELIGLEITYDILDSGHGGHEDSDTLEDVGAYVIAQAHRLIGETAIGNG
ncbi:hypothetical protein [Micromonospora trifolii]|uniref:hypothetical protein n=1 Tax=Micromonospora trifolii TaxID=2911208 RepID=UPI003CE86716